MSDRSSLVASDGNNKVKVFNTEKISFPEPAILGKEMKDRRLGERDCYRKRLTVRFPLQIYN